LTKATSRKSKAENYLRKSRKKDYLLNFWIGAGSGFDGYFFPWMILSAMPYLLAHDGDFEKLKNGCNIAKMTYLGLRLKA
jgi:hypothetical protein